MIFIILNRSEHRKRLFVIYSILSAVWLAYVFLLSQSGLLLSFSLPPKIPLFIVAPAVVAITIITGTKGFRHLLESTPVSLPIYLQSFRIVVELLIYGAFLNGVFPQKATFEGLNFDILVGLSAPVAGYLYQRRRLSDMGLLVWNVVSLIILSVTVYSFISTYYFTDYVRTVGNTNFVQMPYLLLASVLLPVAVFLHIFSLRQLKMQLALIHVK